MRVSDPRLHEKYGREVRNFDIAVWEHERENNVLVGSYAQLAQTPVVRSHPLDTGDRIFAEASPCDLLWGIGYRADDPSARHRPLRHGLNLLVKTLETVIRLFRDRAPPSARHQLFSHHGVSPSRKDCIFEVDPSTCLLYTSPSPRD